MFEKLKSILVEEMNINADEITLDSELTNDLGFNSLELAELVYACEEHYDIMIDEEELRNFRTVGDVVNYLEANVK